MITGGDTYDALVNGEMLYGEYDYNDLPGNYFGYNPFGGSSAFP
jgi:hypothetical protein